MTKSERINMLFELIKSNALEKFNKKLNTKVSKKAIDDPYSGNTYNRSFAGIKFEEIWGFCQEEYSGKQLCALKSMANAVCIYPSEHTRKNIEMYTWENLNEEVLEKFPEEEMINYLKFLNIILDDDEHSAVNELLYFVLKYFSKERLLELACNWKLRKSSIDLNGNSLSLLNKYLKLHLNDLELKNFVKLYRDDCNKSDIYFSTALEIIDALRGKRSSYKLEKRIGLFSNFLKSYYTDTTIGTDIVEKVYKYYLFDTPFNISNEINKHKKSIDIKKIIHKIVLSTNKYNFLNKDSLTQEEVSIVYKDLKDIRYKIHYNISNCIVENGKYYGEIHVANRKLGIKND